MTPAAGLNMARTGNPESVVLNDVAVVWMLKQLVGVRAPMDRLWPGSTDGFRKIWKWGISQLLLDPSVWQPYGLRRGGACEDWATHGDGRPCMSGEGLF